MSLTLNTQNNASHIKRIPTTIITGFLEAGKTTFIQKFLESGEVNRYEHVLLLSCEDGDTEYSSDHFKSDFVEIHHLLAANEFETNILSTLADNHMANRIIIEHNGMWSLEETLTKLPDSFYLTMQAFIAGALLNAIPGIILQLVLIPAIMVALNKAKIVRFSAMEKA